jgi:hypothetical protein
MHCGVCALFLSAVVCAGMLCTGQHNWLVAAFTDATKIHHTEPERPRSLYKDRPMHVPGMMVLRAAPHVAGAPRGFAHGSAHKQRVHLMSQLLACMKGYRG